MVSTGFGRPVGPPSTRKDQAAHRAAIPSRRGKTRPRFARKGRRDRQDRAPLQRGSHGLTTSEYASSPHDTKRNPLGDDPSAPHVIAVTLSSDHGYGSTLPRSAHFEASGR